MSEYYSRQNSSYGYAGHVQASTLVLGQVAVLGATGWIIGGWFLGIFIVAALVYFYKLNPNVPTELIHRIFGGRHLAVHQVPQLYGLVQPLAKRAGLNRLPQLVYLPKPEMIAFTMGGDGQAAIALSRGLLDYLTPRELSAVLAHEIAHIRNQDTRWLAFSSLLSRLTDSLAFFGQMLLFLNLPFLLSGELIVGWHIIAVLLAAPMVSLLLQLALSRKKEFAADAFAAALTQDPAALGNALIKIEQAERNWFRRMLPLRSGASEWLRTHPATSERVRRLKAMAGNGRGPRAPVAYSPDRLGCTGPYCGQVY
jgi:heat shock protein HtpX